MLLAKLINSKQITVNRDRRLLAPVFWSRSQQEETGWGTWVQTRG